MSSALARASRILTRPRSSRKPPRPRWTRGRPSTRRRRRIPELKHAIAEKFNRENNLPYKPEKITTGAGGKHCLYMAFMAILNPGDEVLIPSPYWVSYPEQVKLAGGVNKFIAGEEKNGFKITPQQLEKAITPKTKVLVINSPSNPGGHAYTPEELKALAEVVAKHPNVVVFSRRDLREARLRRAEVRQLRDAASQAASSRR